MASAPLEVPAPQRAAGTSRATRAVGTARPVMIMAVLAVLTHALSAGALARALELQPGAAGLDPLTGAAYWLFGPPGAAAMQLAIVVTGALVCLELSRRRHARLALLCLSLSAAMGTFRVAIGAIWPG